MKREKEAMMEKGTLNVEKSEQISATWLYVGYVERNTACGEVRRRRRYCVDIRVERLC